MTAASDKSGVGDLGARIRRLEAMEDIREVVRRYARAADDRTGCSVNVDETMKLFARNGVWDGSPHWGRFEGWESIRQNLSKGHAGIDWSIHQIVEVSLRINTELTAASGRWSLSEVAHIRGSREDDKLVMLAGFYDNEFIKEEGQWRLSLMRFDCQAKIGLNDILAAPMANAANPK